MIARELIDFLIVSGCKAAATAGEEILKIYNSSDTFDVGMNSDNTVVTEADNVAHEAIKKSLSSTRIPIMSEEGRNILFEERYNWDLYWLVDPLDGTREFIKKNDEFVISIAFMSEKRPLFGVIYIPTEDKLYFSDPDRGAFVVENGSKALHDTPNTSKLFSAARKLKINNENRDKENITVLVTRSHVTKETNDMLESLKSKFKTIEIKHCGSSKKFCMIAEGEADLYFRTTPLFDWDIAAGEVIAAAAGAKTLSLDNTVNEYNTKELYIKPFYSTSLHDFRF